MAIGNMFALSQFAKDWSASLVKPFIFNSRLYGLPHFLSDHKWKEINSSMLTLDHVFDTNNLNRLASLYGTSKFAGFCEFILQASRDVTLIHFINNRESREISILTGPDGHTLHNRLSREHTFECSQYKSVQQLGKHIINSLNKEAIATSSKIFQLNRHYCVNSSIATSSSELAEQCKFSSSVRNLSLLVLNWRGLGVDQIVTNSAKGVHKSRRLIVRNLTLYQHPRGGTHVFSHSHQVLEATRRFMNSFNLTSGQFIGVHIRSEKLGQRDRRIKGFLDECMEKVMRLCEKLRHRHKDLPMVFLSDYGAQGSDSCFACKGAKQVKVYFNRYNITPIHFNEATHSAFIAAVEMELLAHSWVLILVGGGAFEKQITLQKYNLKRKTRQAEIIKVCWDDNALMHLPKTIVQ